MVKWNEEQKLKMLFVIVEHINPTNLPWAEIANNMGPEFTAEAVRQQYKSIKKGFRPTSGSTIASASSAGVSTPSPSAKPKTKPRPIRAMTPGPSPSLGKGRKRKAAEISTAITHEDDDETDALDSSKAIKTEKAGKGTGIGDQVFKVEPNDEEGVDVENDALYDSA